jgi:hypothetical protein
MRRPPPTLCKTSIKLFELLARDPRTSAHSPDWIRQTMVLGGEKRRIVRYVLDHTPSNGNRLGCSMWAPRLELSRCMRRAAEVKSRRSTTNCSTGIYSPILADHGVDYRTCDMASQPGWKGVVAQRRSLLARTLGNIWSPLRLPFDACSGPLDRNRTHSVFPASLPRGRVPCDECVMTQPRSRDHISETASSSEFPSGSRK